MRANITIVDEYFFVDKQKYVEVIKPFQSGKRTPEFVKRGKYKGRYDLVESNKTIYTSSSVLQSHWGYEEYEKFTNKMLNGESYCSIALPVQVNIMNGFKTVEELREMKLDYTSYKWETEMMATFPGMSEDAFFDFVKLNNSRNLKAVYPKYLYELLGAKSKMKYMSKEHDEIRLVSCDIALLGGRKNDKSAYSIIRLIPTKQGYKRQVCYIESHEGMLTKRQAMRINRLFYEFDCDYIVLDMGGVGQSIFDEMTDYVTDDETGEVYPPLNCINDDVIAERCIHRDARKVIYSIKAGRGFNDECYCNLRTIIENGKFELLNTSEEAETFLSNIKGYLNLSIEKQVLFESAYKETNDLIDEMINLEVDKDVFMKEKKIKLKEKTGGRKDHVSSVAYGNYIANELERDYLKKLNAKEDDFSDYICGYSSSQSNDGWYEQYY